MNDIEKQILDLTKIVEAVSQTQDQILGQQRQIVGLTAAFEIVVEIFLSQSPAQKAAIQEGLSQLLARDDLLTNDYAKEILGHVHKAASLPSRMTPEGRRGRLHLVSLNPEDKP